MWQTIGRAAAVMALGLGSVGGTALAQGDYPSKPIQFMIGFPPGGSTDTAARIIAPRMAQILGQPIVLDNKAGAGGVIGVESVASSDPDGYTMGFGVSGALTSNVTLMPNLPYDPRSDLTPVSLVIDNPLVFVASADLGVDNLEGFLTYARDHRGEVSYGTPGPGTAMNLAGELINQETGIGMQHVPYKGSNPALVDVMAGHIEAALIDLATFMPHIDSDRVVALGVTSPERTPLAPEIPTLAEAGIPDYGAQSWFALVMPAGVSEPVLDKVHGALVEALSDESVRERLMAAGLVPATSSPTALAERIDREIDVYAELIKAANITR